MNRQPEWQAAADLPEAYEVFMSDGLLDALHLFEFAERLHHRQSLPRRAETAIGVQVDLVIMGHCGRDCSHLLDRVLVAPGFDLVYGIPEFDAAPGFRL